MVYIFRHCYLFSISNSRSKHVKQSNQLRLRLIHSLTVDVSMISKRRYPRELRAQYRRIMLRMSIRISKLNLLSLLLGSQLAQSLVSRSIICLWAIAPDRSGREWVSQAIRISCCCTSCWSPSFSSSSLHNLGRNLTRELKSVEANLSASYNIEAGTDDLSMPWLGEDL